LLQVVTGASIWKFSGVAANETSNSQGTAVMMNTISKLPEDIKKKVVGVVLFGYTKNGQTKSSIPNYPKENVMVLCSSSDGVCGGQLLVTAGHFSYMADGSGPKAINFLASKINGAGGKVSK
jgi:cutinase